MAEEGRNTRTPDRAEENFRRLARWFPGAVTETLDEHGRPVRAIDADVLRQEISAAVAEGTQERYQFTWPGKGRSLALSNAPSDRTLRLDRSRCVGRSGGRGSIDTENLYIEGDNLEALKLLQGAYRGRIKLIYIDPPYNTGQDFLYTDDFTQGTQEYLLRSGQVDEQGSCLVPDPESGGRLHTDWLNLLYPRLRLARELLREDGVMFASIDCNEAANLKKMMDEVFGEENFQREIIWRMGWLSGFKTAAANFIRNHDSILFYSKNRDKMDFRKQYIPNQDFKPLVKSTPELTEKLRGLGLTGRQRRELLEFINHGSRPARYPLEDTWNCSEYDDLNSIAIVSYSGEKISKLLNMDQEFKGQKAVKLLLRLLDSAVGEEDLVLDFFSGTASMAQAVLQRNAGDGGRRKFILVQLPEPCGESSAAFQAGYPTISDIGQERIRRVGDRLREESGADIDYGFRVLRVDTARPEQAGRTWEDLLFQAMLELGVPLSSPIGELELDGKRVFSVAQGELLACFDQNVTGQTAAEIAGRHPRWAVFRDISAAGGGDTVNFEEIFAACSPETVCKML